MQCVRQADLRRLPQAALVGKSERDRDVHGHRYRVKSGDSLSSIARAQLGKAHYWPRIFSYNNRTDVVAVTGRALADPDRLSIGQLLLLPPPEQVHGHVSHIADQRHPQQATTPRIVPSTAPAQAAAPPASSATPAPKGAAGRSFTTINSYPFKFKLDQIPKQTLEYPLFTATLKFDGTLVIWVDKQITTGAITNKGYEASAKQTAAGVLADLVQDAKIGWEPGSKKASFEDMLTLNAHGAPPSLTSVGIAMDSENAMPAMRFKFQSPKLQGKFRQHLYTAVNFTLTADLRPKKPDSGTRGPVPVPVPRPGAATPAGSAALVRARRPLGGGPQGGDRRRDRGDGGDRLQFHHRRCRHRDGPGGGPVGGADIGGRQAGPVRGAGVRPLGHEAWAALGSGARPASRTSAPGRCINRPWAGRRSLRRDVGQA